MTQRSSSIAGNGIPIEVIIVSTRFVGPSYERVTGIPFRRGYLLVCLSIAPS